MASIQCVRNEEVGVIRQQQLSCMEQSSLDEIIKNAENSCMYEDIEKNSIEIVAQNECMQKDDVRNRITVVVGGLKNQTKKDMNVLDSKKWAGHIVKNYSNPLHSVGGFVESALSNKGVKAAVVYSGKNSSGVDCGWLLAWVDSKACGKRIYADCGPKSKFCNINWGEIEKKLDQSGAVVKVHDKETGTSVYGAIVGHKNKDVVPAVFSG